MSDLVIVTWLWGSTGWRTGYGPEHVNACQRMVAKHLHVPHRFVCVTDNPEGIECETIPLWNHPVVDVERNKPNCYRRLYAFSKEAAQLFGPRFVSLDIDCLIMPGPDGRGITPLFENDADFKILNGWRDERGCNPYNGSLWLMNAGARSHTWDNFDPAKSPAIAAQNKMPNGKNYYGSDQAWIAHSNPNEPTWCREDGILSYVRDMSHEDKIPKDCRIMFFAGQRKPWTPIMSRVHPAIWKEYQKYLQIDPERTCATL